MPALLTVSGSKFNISPSINEIFVLFIAAFSIAISSAFLEISIPVTKAEGRFAARAIAIHPDPVPKSMIWPS